MVMLVVTMTMKEMHERTGENEDEWRVGEDVLPMPDECANHNNGKDVVEPVRNTKVLHG